MLAVKRRRSSNVVLNEVELEYTEQVANLIADLRVLIEVKMRHGVDRRLVFNMERVQSKITYMQDLIDEYIFKSNAKVDIEGKVMFRWTKVIGREEEFMKTSEYELVMGCIKRLLDLNGGKWVISTEHEYYIDNLVHSLKRLKEIAIQLNIMQRR